MKRSLTQQILSTRLRRRGLLVGTGALTGLAIAGQWPQRVLAQTRFSAYPFTLGVASGDPLPDGVVLWTRLAPDPLNGGGMPAEDVAVNYTVATDAALRNVVLQGTSIAPAALAHSVHVEVSGLQPGRTYWYRFEVGGEESPVGRTRTAPAPGTALNQFKFAFANCQEYQNGFYTAYENMAKEDLDLVIHLGDYIYEGGVSSTGVRQHNSPEVTSLEAYRNRYGLYKSDPNLKAAHAAFPWTFTWDDHEVDNNYAGFVPEDDQSVRNFILRRAAASQVYYEHMPLRASSRARGEFLLLYRRLSFGNLVTFNVLDTRQYRTNQPCNDTFGSRCDESFSPAATMTGDRQQNWLLSGLNRSTARWNVIAQQTMFSQFNFGQSQFLPGDAFNADQWDGYVAQRDRLIQFLQARQPANPIVLTGDIHSSWVHDIKTDFDDPASATVGTEFVGTSISSSFGGNEAQTSALVSAAVPGNPHTKFFNGLNRGYVRCTITPETWQSDFRVVSTIKAETAEVSTLASFVVENGQPGAQPV
ncbi:MAG: alkaline phosphatase [Leptolyngbyaceae cyanobacterium SM1_1_3]|nr:alkaline phosphatase [Leptolyngbyaceae cyanobacterium SM1_1_3]NJN04706.1 alkaline phosphatase [Leptolyngbyaceae cyanobacterium RM1_1_2]